MFVWLADAPYADRGIEQWIAPLEALAVLRRDLDVRLHGAGAGSVEEVLAARERLRCALRGVPETDLREARAAIEDMRVRLTRLATCLAELRSLHDRVSLEPMV